MKWTALMAGLVFAASVAHAQPAPPPPPPGAWDAGAFWRGAPESPRERIQFLQDRINRGRSDGSLDPREADRAQHDLDGVRNWIRQAHWDDGGPLRPDQKAHIQRRLDDISRQIRWMRHDGW